MQYFDVILDMDWLVAYHVTVDCYMKEVMFHILDQPEFSFQGSRENYFSSIYFSIQASNLLQKGWQGYLAYLLDNQKEGTKFKDISNVKEFVDVFLEDLSS